MRKKRYTLLQREDYHLTASHHLEWWQLPEIRQ